MAKTPRSSEHIRFVAQQFERAMEALNITQADVARALGKSPSLIGNWKRGDNYPDAHLMSVFCDRYNVSMDFIYRGVISGLSKEMADGLARAKAASREAPKVEAPRKAGTDA